ncbi:MAG: hypothetical protein KTR28_08805 [Micavibrio sp.]|nr:hypothetical protein [Micavibrio sp.]
MLRDHDVFLVIHQLKNGYFYIPEQVPYTSEKEVIAKIEAGGSDDLYQIIKFNCVEGRSRDMTEDFFFMLNGSRVWEYTFEGGLIGCRFCYGDEGSEDENEEHKLDCATQGIGRHGAFGA